MTTCALLWPLKVMFKRWITFSWRNTSSCRNNDAVSFNIILIIKMLFAGTQLYINFFIK